MKSINSNSNSNNKINTVQAVTYAALIIWFAVWAAGSGCSGAGALGAACICLLFGLAAGRLFPALSKAAEWDDLSYPGGSLRESVFYRRHPWVKIVLWTAALHAALYALGYFFDLMKNGYSGGMLNTLERLWTAVAGDGFPGKESTAVPAPGGGEFRAAVFIANASSLGAAVLFYELAALDMEKRDALYGTFLLMIFPGSLFFAAPARDSLFLVLSLGCVFAARKKLWLTSGALGALAAFARWEGLLLAVPLLMEGLRNISAEKPKGTGAAVRLAAAVIAVLGAAACLALSPSPTPFAFIKEQWAARPEGFRPFFAAAAFHADGLLTSAYGAAWAGHMVNLICSLAALGLLAWAMPGLRPSYGAYALCYIAFSIGTPWLLSAPRFLSPCFPLAMALTAVLRKSALRAAAGMLMTVLMTAYLWMCILG